MRRPTLAGLFALSLVVPQVHAQDRAAADTAPRFTAGFPAAPIAPPHNAALDPGGRLGPRTSPALVAAAWEARLRASLTRGLTPAPGGLAPPAAVAPDTTPLVMPPATRPGPFGQYADIGMQLNLRFEMKADQFRNLKCTAFDQLQALSGCHAGFPTITPTPQYSIRTGGTVAQRLHLNVDFDSQREFDANNNIQVWYEGLEDEVVRRVEVGNVTFQMPRSRFITTAIPANNFGIQAIAQVGPLELRGIFAQQKGSVVQDRTYTVGETTTQPLDRVARDLDYEPGRFFFVVDPAAITGYPALDILNLSAALVPPALRVASLRVYRLRAVSPTSVINQNVGGVRAVACGVGPTQPVDCTVQRAGPFQWEVLQEGKDYYVDPSGVWFALANRLDLNDYLAVSYVPVGQTSCSAVVPCVGTFPIVANPDPSVVDTLRLAYDPRPGVTAALPSFRFEIRSAYRVGGSEITRETVRLALTVNQRERTVSTGETYLARLGLALGSDPTLFDQYNRLFPRGRDPQQGAPVRDYFIVFPHLTPFGDSTELGPTERNDSLYRTPAVLLATQAPPSVFALQLHASVSLSGDRGTLSLNSVQIREGSEHIYVGNQLLTRGTDYDIDYPSGTVQFRNPDSLFASGATQVRAQFEERAAFTVAPTAIYGLAGRYDLGDRGAVNLTGLFQTQQSAFTRPPLGSEPSSSFIGGISTDLHFKPTWVTRALDALPGIHTDAPSFLNVSAEAALSRPRPNSLGQATVEDFESDAGRFISLVDNGWHWGSIPTTTRGAESYGFSGAGFDTSNAAALTWQSLPYDRDGSPIQFQPQQIDPTIVTVGQAQSAEPALWITLKPDTVLGLANSSTGEVNWVRPHRDAPRWRSITQVLSSTGIDLSRVEYLELWVWEDNHRTAKANGTALLLDFGSVFEDAVAFVPETLSVTPQGDTVYSGRRAVGQGRLDTEAEPFTHSWSAAIDDEGTLSDRIVDGIWDAAKGAKVDTLPLCSAVVGGGLSRYGFGDLRSRCGRHNGAIDTEDLDGDFQLDSAAGVRTAENFVRYVFPIGDDGTYVRDGAMTPVVDSLGNPDGSAGWRLYRIPFRTDTLVQGTPSLRQVQSLRITVIAPHSAPSGRPDPQVFFGLARVRLVGATWLKRAETPIHGLAGSEGTGLGDVVASVVTTENRDLGYTPPPGVVDEASRVDANVQIGATQINERSLRLLASGLVRGQRAEAFNQFTAAGDKNFLKYRQLRVWARGRGAGWEEEDLHFYIKVGKNADNFYLYHVPAHTTTWEPEAVVDFSHWLALRAKIELEWLQGHPPQVYPGCPDSTLVPFDSSYVMCDGPYIVHVRDPATAPPNLAAVQEIAAGIWRVDTRTFIDQAELWVDDIRLSDVVQDVGTAEAVDLTLSAANVGDFSLSFSRRDGQFRQLTEDPSYTTNNALAMGGTVQLSRFLPDAWGVAMPLSVRYGATSSDPFYLAGTDIETAELQGLRTPQSSNISYSLALRHARRSASPLLRYLLDPFALSGSSTSGTGRTDLSLSKASSYLANLEYALAPGAQRLGPVRITPTGMRFQSSLVGASGTRSTYAVPVARDSDFLIVPTRSQNKAWRNSGSLDLLPLTGVQLRVSTASQRDLHDYGDSTSIGRLVRAGQGEFLGQNVGIETQRNVNTFLSATPRLVSWLRPRASLSTSFTLRRDPNAQAPVRDIGDTAGAFHIPAAFTNSRVVNLGAQLDAHRLGQRLFGDSASLARLLGRLANLDLSWGRSYGSTFFGSPFVPSLGYQLAAGGFDSFRRQGGVAAGSASDNLNVNAAGAAQLPLGLRVSANYLRTNGVTWVLRGTDQVPLRTSSEEWPSAVVSWTLTPPRASVGRVIRGFTARFTYRRRETNSTQLGFSDAVTTALTQTIEHNVAPSLAITWPAGVATSYDFTRVTSDAINAGNLFRTTRSQQNAGLNFTFRPPSKLARLKNVIRASAHYTTSRNAVCLQATGQADCIPYVDSRQSQTQVTLDTDFPPSLSAGFQMAYLINDERQTNHKTAQLVITAFVNFSTSVGQIR
jgi:Motility related/secretion protein